MTLHQKIPEWLPLDGLRVRVQHPGMQKLCNGCYGNHLRRDCTSQKVSWNDYIGIFKNENPDIPESFYGKWADAPPQPEMRKPNEKDFFLPTNQVELDEMMSNMQKSGFDRDAVIQIFKERKAKYDLAKAEYERAYNSESQCR